jgi:hypothetical protein
MQNLIDGKLTAAIGAAPHETNRGSNEAPAMPAMAEPIGVVMSEPSPATSARTPINAAASSQ